MINNDGSKEVADGLQFLRRTAHQRFASGQRHLADEVSGA
jgi:hypothetical protein